MIVDFTPTLGVITLPVLAPIAALLQLLFPGLLRDQWKQYRIAISVLLTQSTILFLQWAAVTWWVSERTWWTSDAAATAAVVVVSIVGLAIALITSMKRRRQETQRAAMLRSFADDTLPASTSLPAGVTLEAMAAARRELTSPQLPPLKIVPINPPPTKVESIALGVFALLGLAWAAYQASNDASPLDQVAMVTAACVVGLLHLLVRQRRDAAAEPSRSSPMWVSTELAFLATLVISGAALAAYQNQAVANIAAGEVAGQWATYRGNLARTGVIDEAAGPMKQPRVLWSFDPGERKGRISIHSSPTVSDGVVFVGAWHDVAAGGYLYCISARDTAAPGAASLSTTRRPGELLWRFSAKGVPGGFAKPIFCAPSLLDGKLYFGEGYHQDTRCRMFCIDASTGQQVSWVFPTSSHTESPPTVTGNRIYFGAGDDGVFCLDLSRVESNAAGPPSPRVLWQCKEIHVDSAPAIAEGFVFVGSVIGDVHARLGVAVIDAADGSLRRFIDTPLPVPGSPAYANGRVYIGLGNGKLGVAAEAPAGALWCIDAKTHERLWEFKTAAGIFNCPAIRDGRIVFSSLDQNVYCLNEAGELRWKKNVGDPVVGAPVVTKDAVYVVTVSGIVKALRLDNGDELWSLDDLRTPDADVYACPALSQGKLYIAARGKVHCIGEQ